MHNSILLAGAGLVQLAFGQVEQPLDRRGLEARATSTATVTKTVTAQCSAAPTVTKTVTVTGSAKPTSTLKTSTTSSKVSSSSKASTTSKASTSSKASTTSSKTTSSQASNPSKGISKTNLTPNGVKAGLSGFKNIDYYPAFQQLAPFISWYSDYYPNTPDSNGVLGVGMLWGADGSACTGTYEDALNTYKGMAGQVPSIMFGFYEPDCPCSSSSSMSSYNASLDWNYYIAPLGGQGTVLGSPSMCKQYDEDWLTPFASGISVPWDVTSIHINKPNLSEVMKDVDYYYNKYKKPIWVSEFACVHDKPSFVPCTDQTEINNFIYAVVPYFQNNPNIVAYGASNGEGLGPTWPLINATTNNLSNTGLTYVNAIKEY